MLFPLGLGRSLRPRARSSCKLVLIGQAEAAHPQAFLYSCPEMVGALWAEELQLPSFHR